MSYGPVDFLALEFDNLKLKGEIMPALMELVEKKIVRVIDLVVVQKDQAGKHEVLELQQLAPEVIAIFDPLMVEISGIVQVEDIDAIAGQMENNTTAAVLLFRKPVGDQVQGGRAAGQWPVVGAGAHPPRSCRGSFGDFCQG